MIVSDLPPKLILPERPALVMPAPAIVRSEKWWQVNMPGMVPGLPFRAPGGTVQTPVDVAGEGTWAGTMTANGGIAAAHNDTDHPGGASCARATANGLTNIKVYWGSGNPKLISKVQIHTSSDSTVWDGGTGTFSIIGSTDDFSSSNVTLFTESGIADPGFSLDIERTMTTQTTAYEYHKFEFTPSPAGKAIIGEVDMWEEI